MSATSHSASVPSATDIVTPQPLPSPSAVKMRQDMIATARRFLQDPSVSSASMAKRIAFLEHKGLTSAEINAAMSSDTNSLPPPPVPTRASQQHQMIMQQPEHRMTLAMATQIAAVLAFTLGALKLLNLAVDWLLRERFPAFHARLRAFFQPHRVAQEKQQLEWQQSVDQTLSQLKDSSDIGGQELSYQMKQEISYAVTSGMKQSPENSRLNDVHSEVKSLKALLVTGGRLRNAKMSSTSSLSSVPAVNDSYSEETIKAASLPAWQLAHDLKDKTDGIQPHHDNAATTATKNLGPIAESDDE